MSRHFSDNAHNWLRLRIISVRTLASLALLPALAALSGCGESWVEVFPVAGVVKFNGQPPVGAQVVLHAVNAVDPNAVTPIGKVKEDGSFQITSYEAGDGAPPGEYVATIQWYQIDKDGIVGANVIPTEYASAKTSPIKVTVNADGPTQLEPIAIVSVKTAGKTAGRVAAR